MTFPPSTDNLEEIITIGVAMDGIFEAFQEGFFLVATLRSVDNNATDESDSMAIRNGVALVRIEDIDSKL